MALGNGGGGGSSAATVKAATTDDDATLCVRERARASRGWLTAALKPRRLPSFATKGCPSSMRRYGSRTRQGGGWHRGRSGAPRGLRGPLAEAPPRNQRGRLTPARRAHGPAVAGRLGMRTTWPTWRGVRGRALERGHDVAARHAPVQHGLAVLDTVFLKILQLKCI
jgi:hypothetical protein